MLVCPQRRLSYLLQQLSKTSRAIYLRPQHQRIDEETDQVFYLGPVAIRDWCSDQQIILPAVTPQQHVEHRQQTHEQRRAGFTCDLLQPVDHLRIDLEDLRSAAITLPRRTLVIRWQFKVRQVAG